MNFDNWKAHPHYLGELMTPAKGKSNLQRYNDASESYDKKFEEYSNLLNRTTTVAGKKLLEQISKLSNLIEELEPIKNVPHLSSGCKTRLRKVWIAETTGRKHRVESEYLEKGLEVEEDLITMYSLHTGDFHKKNKVRIENDWLDGEWDFTTENDTIIVDTKGSWDLFTFYDSYFNKLDTGYKWQLQGYMMLGGKYYAKLVYGLINTPEHLIKAKCDRVMYKMFGNESNMAFASDNMLEEYKSECDYIHSIHIFDDIDLKKKIKIFNLERDESMIEQIAPKIEACRWYLNNIENINEEIEEAA